MVDVCIIWKLIKKKIGIKEHRYKKINFSVFFVYITWKNNKKYGVISCYQKSKIGVIVFLQKGVLKWKKKEK